jgi:hypothetical protein
MDQRVDLVVGKIQKISVLEHLSCVTILGTHRLWGVVVLGKAFKQLLVGGALCAVATFLTMGSAAAQTYTGVTPPNLGGRTAPVVAPTAQVQSVHVASAPAPRVVTAPVHSLAFTGADVISMLALGGALVVLGFFITRRTRTRPAL